MVITPSSILKDHLAVMAVKNTIRPLVISWTGVSSRVMNMRVKLDTFNAKVLSVYAPTFKRPPEEKALFYD